MKRALKPNSQSNSGRSRTEGILRRLPGTADNIGKLWWNSIRKRMYVLLIIVISLFAGCLLLNIMAYKHAYAMLHFTDNETRTQKPESLSVAHKAKILFAGVNIPRPANDAEPSDIGLHFETHRFQSADGLELEAWYVPAEASKGLVLLFHGYSAAKTSLLSAAKTLHSSGYSTFLVDFRGSGGSDGNYTTVGFREADDVVASLTFARALSPGEPVVLYGQSMGGRQFSEPYRRMDCSQMFLS